ncbi:hypothetical protein IAR50_007552 [Cryptococcus sp. DSM 104548]
MQADKGKGKETSPSLQVTALGGPPRLSIHNPPPPSNYSSLNEPAWVDALSGGPADPSKYKQNDGSHDDFYYNYFHRVGKSQLHIGYGTEAQYLVLPGLSENGSLIYQTVHVPRSMSSHPFYDEDDNKPHPPWWDEQMKQSTAWFFKFRENGGMQPATKDGETPKITNPEGNLITDEEEKQKVLSLWSSIAGPDLEQAMEKKGTSYRDGRSRPHVSIVSKQDVDTALTHNPYHFSKDGPEPPKPYLTFNSEYHPDPDNVVIRVKEKNRWGRDAESWAPEGSSHFLIHSEYSKSWLPSTTSILAYPAKIEHLDKLSTEARSMCDQTDEEATEYLQSIIKNGGTAFNLFDKDRFRSERIEKSVMPHCYRGYDAGRLDHEQRGTARSRYIAGSVCRAFEEQHFNNTTRGGSHIPPYVSVPSQYAWDHALKTGWIEVSSLHGPPNELEEILEDTQHRLAAHTGTGTRVEGEAPPPAYDDALGSETRFTSDTGGVGSSTSPSVPPSAPHHKSAGKSRKTGYQDDEILLGQATAGDSSPSARHALQYGASHLDPISRDTMTITRVGDGNRSPGGSRRRRLLGKFCGGDKDSSD